MIINDETILSKFKTKNYSKLSVKERKKLAKDFANAIIKERQIPNVEIEFSKDGFGYDPSNNTLYIDESILKNKVLNSNFVLMTGVIHELRHREQSNEENLFYTGIAYHLSPKEIDAHRFTSSELVKLSDFINENEFDKYVYKLMNNDTQDINQSINLLLLDGYSKDEIPQICKEQAIYNNNFVVDPKDKKQLIFFEPRKPMVAYRYNKKEMTAVLTGRFRMYIVKDQLYIDQCNLPEDISGEELLKEIQGVMNYINQNQQQFSIKEIQNINFAPLHFIQNKKEKEQFFEILGLKNNSISLNNLMSINPENENLKKLNIKGLLNLSTESKMKRIFGIDYKEKYSEDKQAFLESLLPYIDDCEERKLFPDPKDKSEEYFAIESYKPEYSLEKLNLIFEAQKRGLNTMYYDSLSEEQIKILMDAQTKGISREEIKELISSFKKTEANAEKLRNAKENESERD